MEDKPRSLYMDMPDWDEGVKVDDFIVAIGKKQSNSVYHVARIKSVIQKKDIRAKRYYMEVYKSDLPTALQRESSQKIIPIHWYPRGKKKTEE